jgi:arylsulfatase A-like enzyme
VLIVLDTVRADRVRCVEEGASLTPELDAFCKRSIRFTRASSTSSWTLPAHASLFTGLYPIEHGATQEHTRLDADAVTLAEILGARGYRTYGVSANPMVSRKSGLARGFDSFEETWRSRRGRGFPEAAEHPNNRAVADLLGAGTNAAPFFLFVNYIEAHRPNNPPEPYRSRALSPGRDEPAVKRARQRSARNHYLDPAAISAAEFAILGELYDGEIAYLDALVGGLLARMEADGQLENTLVIVTSDHGENLGDRGHFRHIFSLTGGSVRVPLLIRLPGDRRAGEVNAEPVGLVDVFATLLAQAGAEPPSGPLAGRDLLASPDTSAAVVAEYYFPNQALGLFAKDSTPDPPPQLGPYLRRLRSIEADGLRFVWGSDGRHELYDLAADPEEHRDRFGDPRFAAATTGLRERLDAFVQSGGGPTPLPEAAPNAAPTEGVFEDLDPESARLLRELGYLPD